MEGYWEDVLGAESEQASSVQDDHGGGSIEEVAEEDEDIDEDTDDGDEVDVGDEGGGGGYGDGDDGDGSGGIGGEGGGGAEDGDGGRGEGGWRGSGDGDDGGDVYVPHDDDLTDKRLQFDVDFDLDPITSAASFTDFLQPGPSTSWAVDHYTTPLKFSLPQDLGHPTGYSTFQAYPRTTRPTETPPSTAA